MENLWIVIALIVSFAISALVGRWLIPFLKKIHFGQTIKEVGPTWHESKKGTPIMGGFMFVIGISVTLLIVLSSYIAGTEGLDSALMSDGLRLRLRVIGGVVMSLAFCFVGFLDDYLKAVKKRNLGLKARYKLILQTLITASYLYLLYTTGQRGETVIPFAGVIDIGVFYWIISFFLIIFMVNAVNLTDGIDGLASCVTIVYAIIFILISTVLSLNELSIVSAALGGGCAGFLIWNFHPAKVFMGDTGSLFLGGMVVALAYSTSMPIILIPAGILYIMEAGSVVLQMSYFKITHGKRIFKMSPIHHHFEMCKWSEVKICVIFSVVGLIGGLIALSMCIWG